MIGAFQYFFIERGLFWDSFLTIWTHGTLEISAIIIAGAAGATMGRGLVFPGTYTRTQAFQRSARRGVKMMVGTVPLFILAGFIEGFLTRNTETPDVIRALFILICLLFVLLYFVWYPSIRGQIKPGDQPQDPEIAPDSSLQINFRAIKSTGTIFSDTFLIFKAAFGKIAVTLLGLSLGYCALAFSLSESAPQDMLYYRAQAFAILGAIDPLMTGRVPPWMWIYNGIAFAVLAYVIFWQIDRMQPDKQVRLFQPSGIIACLSGGLLMAGALHLGSWWSLLLFTGGFNIILLWMYTCHQENRQLFGGLSRSLSLLGSGYWKSLGLLMLTFGTGIIFISLVDTALAQIFFELIGWIINFDQETMNNISVVILTFLYVFLLFGTMGMLVASLALFYHSRLEVKEARHLRERLAQFGASNQIRGMERE
jgi:hypothetical protein